MLDTTKLKCIMTSFALEKTILLSMIAVAISENCSFNLMFQKTCDKNSTGPIYLGKKCPNERPAQTETAGYNIYKSMIYSILVSLVLLYAGTWSDSHGKRRKPMILIPLVGQLITDGMNGVCSHFWSIPANTVGLLNGLVPGISGGRLLLFTGAVCYVTDTTVVETRTFRIGILACLYFVATPTGDTLSGILSIEYGFVFVFSLCVILNVFAILNCVIFMLDTSEDYDEDSVQSITSQIIDNLKVVVKKRPKKSRMIVILALIASPLVRSPMVGEASVLYLFVRYKFGWNESDYGYYAAFQLTGLFIGTMISLGILSKVLGVRDSLIGILASISDMAAATSYLFVSSSWQMYVVPFLDIFHGAVQVVCSSILSKHVDSTEVGKVSSVKGFFESITPFLAIPLYNYVYIQTIDYLPSAFYIVSIAFGLPIFVIFWIISISERSEIRANSIIEDDMEIQKSREQMEHRMNSAIIEESKSGKVV